MLPPLRSIVAIAVALALAALAIWTVLALPRSRRLLLTGPPRTALTIFVVAVLLVMIGWLVFILPAYWD